jgi:hypothetical protein
VPGPMNKTGEADRGMAEAVVRCRGKVVAAGPDRVTAVAAEPDRATAVAAEPDRGTAGEVVQSKAPAPAPDMDSESQHRGLVSAGPNKEPGAAHKRPGSEDTAEASNSPLESVAAEVEEPDTAECRSAEV